MTDQEGCQPRSVETHDRIHWANVTDSDKRLMLVSWDLLLQRLAAAVSADSQVASDIQQLRGFVEQQDLAAFQPIQPGEFSPWLARRVRWINNLIDDVVDAHGVPEGWISVSGLRATPQRAGYGRYFRFLDDAGDPRAFDLFLCVDFSCWATEGDTPLWLWIDDLYMPIYPKTGVAYHSVLNDVVSQLREVSKNLDDVAHQLRS